MGWTLAYIAVGLVSVGYAAFSAKRHGEEMDPDRAIVGTLAWPVFFALVIGEMLAARQAKGEGQ